MFAATLWLGCHESVPSIDASAVDADVVPPGATVDAGGSDAGGDAGRPTDAAWDAPPDPCPPDWAGPLPADFGRRFAFLEVAMSSTEPQGTLAYSTLEGLWSGSSDLVVAVTEYAGSPSPSDVDFTERHAAYSLTPDLLGLVDGWRSAGAMEIRFWQSATQDSLDRHPDPRCGVAVCAVDRAEVVVRAACEVGAPDADRRLHVWLVDPEVVGPPQRNGGNEVPFFPYEGMGDPIEDFVHREVVVGVLDGDPLAGVSLEAVTGRDQLFVVTPAGCDECAVVAFVGEAVPGDSARREVIDNVARAPLGSVLRWE